MKKLFTALLCCAVLCALLSACTRLPRLEEGSTAEQTLSETPADTSDTNEPNTGSEPNTDANGFPNDPEDGHSKRY